MQLRRPSTFSELSKDPRHLAAIKSLARKQAALENVEFIEACRVLRQELQAVIGDKTETTDINRLLTSLDTPPNIKATWTALFDKYLKGYNTAEGGEVNLPAAITALLEQLDPSVFDNNNTEQLKNLNEALNKMERDIENLLNMGVITEYIGSPEFRANEAKAEQERIRANSLGVLLRQIDELELKAPARSATLGEAIPSELQTAMKDKLREYIAQRKQSGEGHYFLTSLLAMIEKGRSALSRPFDKLETPESLKVFREAALKASYASIKDKWGDPSSWRYDQESMQTLQTAFLDFSGNFDHDGVKEVASLAALQDQLIGFWDWAAQNKVDLPARHEVAKHLREGFLFQVAGTYLIENVSRPDIADHNKLLKEVSRHIGSDPAQEEKRVVDGVNAARKDTVESVVKLIIGPPIMADNVDDLIYKELGSNLKLKGFDVSVRLLPEILKLNTLRQVRDEVYRRIGEEIVSRVMHDPAIAAAIKNNKGVKDAITHALNAQKEGIGRCLPEEIITLRIEQLRMNLPAVAKGILTDANSGVMTPVNRARYETFKKTSDSVIGKLTQPMGAQPVQQSSTSTIGRGLYGTLQRIRQSLSLSPDDLRAEVEKDVGRVQKHSSVPIQRNQVVGLPGDPAPEQNVPQRSASEGPKKKK